MQKKNGVGGERLGPSTMRLMLANDGRRARCDVCLGRTYMYETGWTGAPSQLSMDTWMTVSGWLDDSAERARHGRCMYMYHELAGTPPPATAYDAVTVVPCACSAGALLAGRGQAHLDPFMQHVLPDLSLTQNMDSGMER